VRGKQVVILMLGTVATSSTEKTSCFGALEHDCLHGATGNMVQAQFGAGQFALSQAAPGIR